MVCPNCIRSLGPAAIGNTLLQYMRAWLALMQPERDPPATTIGAIAASRPTMRAARALGARSGVLLPFPIRGEALLVRLAALLRARMGEDRPGQDPLDLSIVRDPYSRLTIDAAAYVEYDPTRSQYRAAVEASVDTKVILETTDFDALVEFVVRYIATRPSETSPLEAAS